VQCYIPRSSASFREGKLKIQTHCFSIFRELPRASASFRIFREARTKHKKWGLVLSSAVTYRVFHLSSFEILCKYHTNGVLHYFSPHPWHTERMADSNNTCISNNDTNYTNTTNTTNTTSILLILIIVILLIPTLRRLLLLMIRPIMIILIPRLIRRDPRQPPRTERGGCSAPGPPVEAWAAGAGEGCPWCDSISFTSPMELWTFGWLR